MDGTTKVKTQKRATMQIVMLIMMTSVLSAFFARPRSAMAQAEKQVASTDAGSELSRAVQAQATNLLGRHLRPEEFQVFAKVALPPPERPVPYLPDSLAPVAGANASPNSLRRATKSIEIEVILADRYDADARSKLKGILVRALELNEARGDKVTFSSLGLKLDRPESDMERDLVKAEADARDYKARMDAITRERDDAKRETEGVKRDLAMKSELEDKKPGQDEPASSTPPTKTFVGEYAPLFVGSVIALLAIFALRGAATRLSAAVQSIGAGIPALGEKLGESLAQQSPLMLPPSESERRGQDFGGGRDAAPALMAAAAHPIEAVARRVLELHEELSQTVNEATESLVIEYLSYLLEDDSMTSRAVATMELLGKDKANLLYGRLAPSHRQKVSTFLKKGAHSKPKGEVMLEAGEELKTRIFGAAMPNSAKLDDAVTHKMNFLSLDDRVAVARALDSDKLARFFLYLDPPKLASLLCRLREKDSKRFDLALPLVLKAPDVEAANHLDSEIMAALEAQIVKASADVQAPYLHRYKTLVEAVGDDDVAEIMVEGFASANPRVERFVRETIVTFGTFFKLHGDLQEEIVTGLSNKDLAALVAPLKPELRSAILAHVDDRSKSLVDEEIDRLASRGARQAAVLHKDMKKRIVARIIQIKGTAPISELLAKKIEGLPAASAQPGDRAA